MDYIALGKRIRKQRKSAKLTQAGLADKVGLSPSFLGHVERGNRKASLETVVAIANTLHVSVDMLLSESLDIAPDDWMEGAMEAKQEQVMRRLVRSITENWDDWLQEEEE